MLNYLIDIDKKSVWTYTTPNETATDLPFFCSEVGDFYAKEKFFTERDTKNSYWLVYTVSGEGELTYKKSTHKLTKGSCVLIDCREYQHYKTAENCPLWHHFWVHLDGFGVKSLYPLINPNLITVFTPNEDEIFEIFKEVFKNAKQNTISESLKISFLLHKILNILATMKLNFDNSDNDHEILEIANFIRLHYREKLQIDQLSDKINLSKYYFIRKFKQILGTTPYDYLMHFRITKAKELLCTTNWSTGSIGLHVGFSSESNFTMQFTKIVSQSPAKYRKEHYVLEESLTE